MTEDEAKTKWCPFVRIQVGAATNRPLTRVEGAENVPFCIGNACMAWRTMRTEYEFPIGAEPNRVIALHGYCGAFGK